MSETQWVSVKDRLPDMGTEVIVWVKYRRMRMRPAYETFTDSWREQDGSWAMGSAKSYEITHWFLPSPPCSS